MMTVPTETINLATTFARIAGLMLDGDAATIAKLRNLNGADDLITGLAYAAEKFHALAVLCEEARDRLVTTSKSTWVLTLDKLTPVEDDSWAIGPFDSKDKARAYANSEACDSDVYAGMRVMRLARPDTLRLSDWPAQGGRNDTANITKPRAGSTWQILGRCERS